MHFHYVSSGFQKGGVNTSKVLQRPSLLSLTITWWCERKYILTEGNPNCIFSFLSSILHVLLESVCFAAECI
jgi:hypothetical protein